MRNSILGVVTVVAGFGLSGCDGADPNKFINDINEFESGLNVFFAQPITSAADMPSAGSASYNGFIYVYQGTDEVAGRANLNANFGNATINMTTSDYFRFDQNLALVGSADGNLAMNDGIISTSTGQGRFSGTLTGSVDGQSFDGAPLDGVFNGTNASGVYGTDSVQVEVIAER